ncbi:hypothetical protein ACFYT3_33280 [Nocardia amikacinitolerans]|uniref:hypothetical protein n=1 Tax=Nocardia amikacinitolerans TaxID=756689 RepID=UPI0020A5B828|nr:hypothetical protein [Nocardia amikacinitolerans]MCP2292614.1 hypothetical protein [Nocardia amikacinitolerans]
MTIHTTAWTMISDLSPESAYRDGADLWRLSWLPGRTLSREQALAGMELDELLSDPDMVHDRIAHAHAAERADRLGILLDHAIILLHKRIVARLRDRPDESAPGPVGACDPSGPRARCVPQRASGPPRVYG